MFETLKNRKFVFDNLFKSKVSPKYVAIAYQCAKILVKRVLDIDKSQYVVNPAIAFNEELRESLDDYGKFKPGTRLGEMSEAQYAAERRKVTLLSQFWGDDKFISRSELEARFLMSDYDSSLLCELACLEDCCVRLSEDDVVSFSGKSAICENTEFSKLRYAGKVISRLDLAQYDDKGNIIHINHILDDVLADIFIKNASSFISDSRNFVVDDCNLLSSDYVHMYVEVKPCVMDSKLGDIQYITKVTDDFYRFLLEQDSWVDLAQGCIEDGIKSRLLDDDFALVEEDKDSESVSEGE